MKLFEKDRHLGGTGTSGVVSVYQIKEIRLTLQLLWDCGYRVFHHGDCIGGDEAMHNAAILIGYETIIHPPINPNKRAYNSNGIVLPEFPYLVRNRHIVEAVSRMIAVPKEKEEQLRSGTWATVRYARRMKVPIDFIYP